MKKQILFWKPIVSKKIKPIFNLKQSFSPINLKLYPFRTKQETKLIDRNPFGDIDKDKVPNWFDCKPLNRNMQGRIFIAKKFKIFYPYKNKKDMENLPRIKFNSKDYRRPSRRFGPESDKRLSRGQISKKNWNKLQKARSTFFINKEGELELIEKAQRVEHRGRPLRRSSDQVKREDKLEKWYKEWLKTHGMKITPKRERVSVPKISIKKASIPSKENDEERLAGLTLESEELEDVDDTISKRTVKKIKPVSIPTIKPATSSIIKPILSSSISNPAQVNDEELTMIMMKEMGKTKETAAQRIKEMTIAQKQEYYDFVKQGKLKAYKHYKKVKPFSWSKKGTAFIPAINEQGIEEPYIMNKPIESFTAQDFIDIPKEELEAQVSINEKQSNEEVNQKKTIEPTAQELIDEVK